MGRKKERIIAYIDGFNLYFGMTHSINGIKWLDVEKLVKSLLRPHQELVGVKYFTSRVSNDPPKERRQSKYLDALHHLGIDIIYGNYKSKTTKCNRCRHTWGGNEEKMTDVNIAVHMIIDALHDRFDTAMLISGDSDLVPPINAVHGNFPDKRVFVAFPPNRHNRSVKNVAKGSIMIGEAKLRQAQLPESIVLANGYNLQKPGNW